MRHYLHHVCQTLWLMWSICVLFTTCIRTSLPPSLSTSQYCLPNCILFRIPGFHIWTISWRSFCWWHWSQLFSRGCWIYTYPLLRCCYWCKHICQNSFTCMFLSQLMGENCFSVEQHTYADWTKPSVSASESPAGRFWNTQSWQSELNWVLGSVIQMNCQFATPQNCCFTAPDNTNKLGQQEWTTLNKTLFPSLQFFLNCKSTGGKCTSSASSFSS